MGNILHSIMVAQSAYELSYEGYRADSIRKKKERETEMRRARQRRYYANNREREKKKRMDFIKNKRANMTPEEEEEWKKNERSRCKRWYYELTPEQRSKMNHDKYLKRKAKKKSNDN